MYRHNSELDCIWRSVDSEEPADPTDDEPEGPLAKRRRLAEVSNL